MKKIELLGSVRDGELKINRSQLQNELKLFGNHGIRFVIEQLSKRSSQQNRFYWACITILADHLGYTKEECHEIVKFKFLKREKVDESTGEVYEYLKSTSELSKEDFAEFIGNLQRWSAESLGCVLPDPGTQILLCDYDPDNSALIVKEG